VTQAGGRLAGGLPAVLRPPQPVPAEPRGTVWPPSGSRRGTARRPAAVCSPGRRARSSWTRSPSPATL